ncbi:MAG TPA: hypothetical protein VFH66_10080 [Mycobacteriales bacterium]|nr:hypothetical protein [Mycobacteriales bacterium]
MAEDYVRPPLFASEPPSPTAARWRFRLVLGAVFLLLIAVFALLLFTVILGNGEGNPGLNNQGLGGRGAATARMLSPTA